MCFLFWSIALCKADILAQEIYRFGNEYGNLDFKNAFGPSICL